MSAQAGDLRALLVDVGALREGHFLLTSGRHSDRFFLLARLFEHPEAGERAARALAAAVRGRPELGPVRTVLGPAMGGILLAYDLARQLGARAMFAEKEADGTMRLRRGFRLARGERVLVAEDAVTTGGSVRRAVDAALAQGADVAAVATVVRRGHHALAFGQPLLALIEDGADDWAADDCPLCREGSAPASPKA